MSARLEFTGATEGPHAWRLDIWLKDGKKLTISLREVIGGRFEIIVRGSVASVTYETAQEAKSA